MTWWGKLVYGAGGKLCYGTDGKLVYAVGAKLVSAATQLVYGSASNATKSTAWTNTLTGVDGLFVRSWGAGGGDSYGRMLYIPATEWVPAKWVGYAGAVGTRFPVQSALIGEDITSVRVTLSSANLLSGQDVTISMRTSSSASYDTLTNETASPVWSGTDTGDITIDVEMTMAAYFFIIVAFDPWGEPGGSGDAYKYTASIGATVIVYK